MYMDYFWKVRLTQSVATLLLCMGAAAAPVVLNYHDKLSKRRWSCGQWFESASVNGLVVDRSQLAMERETVKGVQR